jgi:hypothetical protein
MRLQVEGFGQLWLLKTLYLWIEECRRSGATAARQIEKTWAGEGRG